MTLEEIKKWRKESTADNAAMTFISRVDRLIEMADAAEKLRLRLESGRDYLMQVPADKITVEDTLDALGFGREGLGV